MRARLLLGLLPALAGCAEVIPDRPPDYWSVRAGVVPGVYQAVPVVAGAGSSVSVHDHSDLVLAALLAGAAWRYHQNRRHHAHQAHQAAPVVLAGHPGRVQHNPHGDRHGYHRRHRRH